MKKKLLFLLSILALLSTAWIMLDDRQGIAVFQLETDVEDAIAIIQKYDLEISSYTMIPPDVSYVVYSSKHIYGKEWTTPTDLKNIYWQNFETTALLRDITADDIADLLVGLDMTKWAEHVTENEKARQNFDDNVDGCWNENDCPGYYVLSANLYGPTAELLKLAGEPLVQFAGWHELLDPDAILTPEDQEVRHQEPLRFPFTQVNPEPIDWAPNRYKVTGLEVGETLRVLNVNTLWNDESRLAHFARLKTNLRIGLWFTTDPEKSYYSATADIFGYPHAEHESSLPSYYLDRRGVFSGGQGIDLGAGTIKPENLQTAEPYFVRMVTLNGELPDDKAALVAQAGATRLCSWPSYWCTWWGDTAPLILSKENVPLTFPNNGIEWRMTDKDLDGLERIYMPNIQKQ